MHTTLGHFLLNRDVEQSQYLSEYSTVQQTSNWSKHSSKESSNPHRPSRGLSFVSSLESPELNYLQLAKITALLEHKTVTVSGSMSHPWYENRITLHSVAGCLKKFSVQFLPCSMVKSPGVASRHKLEVWLPKCVNDSLSSALRCH